MRRTVRIPVLFSVVSLAACRGDARMHGVDPAQIPVVALESEILPTDEELLAPRKIFALASCLALFESRNNVGFLRFIDKRSGRLLASYGNIGKAEGEFLQPNVFASGSGLLIASLSDSFVGVELGGEGVARTVYPLTGEDAKLAFGANYAAVAGDGTVVFSSPSSSDRLIFRSSDGSRHAWNDYPIEMPEHIEPFYCKEVIMQSSYTFCPSTAKLFAAAQYYPIAEVIDLRSREGTAVRLEGVGSNEYEVHAGIPAFSDPILFYTYTAASQDRFYALYQHARSKEMRQGRSELHLFDSQGRLIRRYALDRRIYHFAVEADGSAVYALGLDGELLPALYLYRLPE